MLDLYFYDAWLWLYKFSKFMKIGVYLRVPNWWIPVKYVKLVKLRHVISQNIAACRSRATCRCTHGLIRFALELQLSLSLISFHSAFHYLNFFEEVSWLIPYFIAEFMVKAEYRR